jgi:hypothetical protein
MFVNSFLKSIEYKIDLINIWQKGFVQHISDLYGWYKMNVYEYGWNKMDVYESGWYKMDVCIRL